ncbi:hypothetical protein OAJ36_02695 [Nitrosopumilus sp.]|nr:hypothetical protein [Nitrosopumilus sp.]
MSQKEIQESLDLLEKDWDFDPILRKFVLGQITDVSDYAIKVKDVVFHVPFLNSEKKYILWKCFWPDCHNCCDRQGRLPLTSDDLITIDDIANILKVTKITPQKIVIYVNSDEFKSKVYRKILGIMVGGQNNMGVVMKELIADPQTTDAKKMPDFIQKVIKDLHSESEEIKSTKLESEEFDEKQFLSAELSSIGKKEFGVDIEVFGATDEDIYDPKGKARHARPFKPAILIE